MTQSSCFLTNGSSLEDCHTNFFALADLCGIKWRQYSCDKNFNDLNEDPILNSFAKCINANLLCVWRRIPTYNTQEHSATTPTRDLYINYSKELWIFWYGDEPDLKELISANLKEGEQGSWESGISYECRTLLFKALHNLIERCLLSKGYARLGRWFFQAKKRDMSDIVKEGTQITFRFNFFLHGDSNVCANVDVRQHSAVRQITKDDIIAAQQLPEGIQVILSPYGLQGSITGFVFKDNEQNVHKFLSDWDKIYPLPTFSNKNPKEKSSNNFSNTFTNATNTSNNEDMNNLGPNDFSNKVVEVIVGNCRMEYPLNYVFITETEANIVKVKLSKSSPNDKFSKNLFETSAQLNNQAEEHLENIKLEMTPYYNYSPNDTYFLKNHFNQVMNFCDRTNNNTDKVERNKNENISSNESVFKKNCNCPRCQNPNYRRHCKSTSSFSTKSSKSHEKDKRNSKNHSTPFHHRLPMDVMHELNSFYVFSSTSQSNIDDTSPMSATVSMNKNGDNNATSITPINMSYKSPVSTSTSSILNTPGIESSPMSNFNIESHEHISPLPSKEEISLINTPTNNQSSNSPKDKSSAAFDSGNSVNINCDPTVRNQSNSNMNGNGPNNESSADQQFSVNATSESNQNFKLEKKHFKRSYRYKSIYDDDSTYKLRTGLLYDFSNEINGWEESPPKNRRFKQSFNSNADPNSEQQSFSENRDPYEFSDFDDGIDYFGANPLKNGHDIVESDLNVNTVFPLNGLSDIDGMNKVDENEQNNLQSKYSNGNIHNGNIATPISSTCNKTGETGVDQEFLNSPSEDLNSEYTGGKNSNAGSNNDQETVISSLNNSNVLPAELLRMFPTPPSLEGMVSSPISNYVGPEQSKTETKLEQQQHQPVANNETGEKSEITTVFSTESDSMDTALVYMPPVQSIFITSNKYAPLENIECRNTLPSNFHYKHNTTFAPNLRNQQMKNFNISYPQPLSQLISKPAKPPHYPLVGANANQRPNQFPNPMIRTSTRVGNCTPNIPSSVSPAMHRMRQMNVQQPQYLSNHIQLDNQFNSSPILNVSDKRRSSPFIFPQQQHTLNSPSNPNHLVMNNSNGIPSKMIGPNIYHQNMNHNNPVMDSIQSIANECNSLMLNLILSDSMFNLFRDHNFETCSICVCNTNIKGNDVGIYLPDGNSQSQQSSNYDYYTTCTCGFSAITNRHLSYLAGLFYEDEVEITGIYYDPIEANKENNNQDLEHYLDKECKKCLSDLDENFIKLLINESTTLLPSASTLANLMYCEKFQSPKIFSSKSEKNQSRKDPLKLIYDDYVSVINISLQMARSDSSKSNMLMPSFNHLPTLCQSKPILHDWQFRKSNFPVNNHEVMRTLKSLQPLMQESVQRKGSLNEVTYNTVSGPLTWRQFHRLATRGTECQCEPQPIPSLLVGFDKDCVAMTPFGLKFWEKFSLEPYAITRDVYYIVITNHDGNLSTVKNFFKELSTTYEILRLGRHAPLAKVASDGIYVLGNISNKYDSTMDDWFNQLGDSDLASKIRSYAQALYDLLPYLAVSDRGQFDAKSSNHHNNKNNMFNSNNSNNISMMNSVQSMNGNVSNSYLSNSSIISSSYNNSVNQKSINSFSGNLNNNSDNQVDRLLNEIDSHASNQEHNVHSNSSFQPYDEEEDPHKYPSIVIYVLESFSQLGKEIAKFGSIGLLKTFSILKKYFPEQMKNNIHMQMLSINSVICNDKDFRDYSRQSQMKELAFAVYSQCKQHLVMQSNIKSLTGLGPAASFEMFLKNKNSIYNRMPLYTTPFILAPMKDKQTELGEMFGDRREKSQILYCSYCLTEDKKWLIASCTNDKGDILHTKVININIPNRTRRRKASVRRFGLDKLMRFIQTVMAESVLPWRLIIGRLGRIGHGELKDWALLLSKKSLLKYSRQLREMCEQCRYLSPNEQPAIYSACLISLEAETALRVFPNYYTPDERFSSSCNTCSLSTPEDASCTHILVFPTSATTQASHANFNVDPEFLGLGFGNIDETDVLPDVEDDMGLFDNFFNDALLSPRDGFHPDSPGNRQVFGGVSNTFKNTNFEVDSNEVPQLLQQPLALAFYVSTAKTGPLPRWFWSHCPHLENVCPVFLKSALLIHTPSVQQNSDDILQSNNRDCHSLDSSLTTDVLRYSLEGYNALSWLVLNPVTNDRISCLPLHIQVLMQLYHTVQALVQ